MIYFGTAYIDFLNANDLVSIEQKTILSIFPTVAVWRASDLLGRYEVSGIGLSGDNVRDEYLHYKFSIALIMMIVSFFLFFFLGLYFDNVLSTSPGVRKPFYFCLTKGFWSRRKKMKISMENSMDEDIECIKEKGDDFEPPSDVLKKQELEKKVLKVEGLRKTFSNGF